MICFIGIGLHGFGSTQKQFLKLSFLDPPKLQNKSLWIMIIQNFWSKTITQNTQHNQQLSSGNTVTAFLR